MFDAGSLVERSPPRRGRALDRRVGRRDGDLARCRQSLRQQLHVARHRRAAGRGSALESVSGPVGRLRSGRPAHAERDAGRSCCATDGRADARPGRAPAARHLGDEPVCSGAARRSPGTGTIGFATVAFDQRANVLPTSAIKKVIATATAARSPDLQVELGGQAIEQAQQASIGYTAIVGLGAAIVVLLISFGSMLAMGLPIVTALFGLGTGLGLIGLLSRVLSMPDFSSELALMIGLGVGIDYALFIVTRYREAFHRERRRRPRSGRRGDEHCRPGRDLRRHHGRDRADGDVRARESASSTGSRSPRRSRCCSCSPRRSRCFRRCSHSSADGSASRDCSPAAARRLTRTGAASGRAGSRRSSAARGWRSSPRPRSCSSLASPALSLRLGNTDAGNDPQGADDTQGLRPARPGFGKGFSGPLLVAVKLPGPGRHRRTHQTRLRPPRDAGRRRRLAAAPEPKTRRRDHLRLPRLLAAKQADREPRQRTSASDVIPPIERATRTHRLHRRRHRRPDRLLARTGEQALAVHRRRRPALRAAADGRLPLAPDPPASSRDEPALDRRLDGHRRRRLPVGLARLRPRHRSPARSRPSCR